MNVAYTTEMMNMNVWWPKKNVVTSCTGSTNLMMATNTMVLTLLG